MIGTSSDGWKWAQASGLSVALHGAALAYLIWQPGFDFFRPDPAGQPAVIDITTLTSQASPDIPEVTTETLTSTIDPAGTDEEGTRTAPEDPLQGQPAETLPRAASSTLTPAPAGEAVAAQSSEEELLPARGEPSTLPVQSPEIEAPPPDPRLLQLVDRIREQLTDPCLLALPLMQGEGQLTLSLLSDSDRNVSQLTDRLTQGIAGEITQETLLLDRRQCPAVAFVRRDQRYPVFALGLQLQSQSVATGQSLRGSISNGAGYVQTLLMVDENGVVHDLRRFLTSSARETRFDIPVARMRQPRDTRQLLIALATPSRLNTVTRLSGDAAEPFFDALYAEIGQNALIGITSVDIR